jgi:hypothetical protein
VNAQQPEIYEVREIYFNMRNDDCNALTLARKFDKTPPGSALLMGYHGASLAAAPVCINNPVKKLSYFKKGRQLLDEAVKKDPGNIEIRFLRFATQNNAPGFLGYNDNLDDDKTFIIKNIRKISVIRDKEIKNIMLNFIIESKNTDQNDDKIVKDFLKELNNN